ncbi:RNA 2',3'-cyclic phosphodiesterase [Streptomyces sp. NPDC003077]|uniref:RNA 2',3'-cyclic phosphodiesterase n=1 Tax=Streptomyces sp. NPDC003077 TaxID=3154443 RepID=UPI0033A76725
MRLFAAVLPPDACAAELAGAVTRLRRLPGADDLRWTGQDGWHFTLAFFGEVPDDVLPGLRERLARAARRHPPYPLRLAGGGRFSDRVLWAGAEGDRAAMRGLAGSVAAGARRAGVAMDQHVSYTPHLTLARSRTGAVDLKPFVAELAGFRSAEWTVAELVLVRSNLPPGGAPGARPRYETVAGWPLGR